MFSCGSNGVELPVEILVDHVLPLLDRVSFDRLGVTSRRMHRSIAQQHRIIPPWPDRIVAKNHLCRMRALAFSPNGQIIACGCSDGRLRLWNVKTGEQPENNMDRLSLGETITSVVFSHNGKLLASACTDHTIQLWDLEMQQRKTINVGHVSCLRFAPSDDVLVSGHYNSELVQFWSVVDGHRVRKFCGSALRVSSLEFSRNGESLIVNCGDDCLKIWNLAKGTYEIMSSLGGFYNVVGPSSGDDEDKGILVASAKSELNFELVWNAQQDASSPSTTERQRFSNVRPHEICFSPNGGKMASVDGFRSIKVWSLPDGSLQSVFEDTSVFSFHALTISPDSNTIGAISRNQNLVRLFRL